MWKDIVVVVIVVILRPATNLCSLWRRRRSYNHAEALASASASSRHPPSIPWHSQRPTLCSECVDTNFIAPPSFLLPFLLSTSPCIGSCSIAGCVFYMPHSIAGFIYRLYIAFVWQIYCRYIVDIADIYIEIYILRYILDLLLQLSWVFLCEVYIVWAPLELLFVVFFCIYI